jgi:hypothetical protein
MAEDNHFTFRFSDNLTQNSRQPELSRYTYTHLATYLPLVPTYTFNLYGYFYVV